MPLFSQTFKGDAKLEACLVNDAAHLTLGTTGAHVAKVQAALILLEAVDISIAERGAQLYGASTAAAVLAYKVRRRIINRTYQSQADNIVGKMTMAALDREMLQMESAGRDRNACAGVRTQPFLR